MPTSAFTKFNDFVVQRDKGVHDFSSHAFKVALTNTAPSTSNTVLTDITQIAAGGGYSAGGYTVTVTESGSAGTSKVFVANATITATGAAIATFRYVVLYNNTSSGKNLIGWLDYGSALNLADGEALALQFDQTNGLLSTT